MSWIRRAGTFLGFPSQSCRRPNGDGQPKETPAKTKFSDPANSTEPIKVADSNATKPVKELTVEEKEIRRVLKKPTGELTKADLEKVKGLDFNGNQLTKSPEGLEKLTKLKDLFLSGNQLTNVKGLENLTQLKDLFLEDNKLTDVKGLEKLNQLMRLNLRNNPDLTKAQIAELQKALPKCKIHSNPTK
jgi:Leucine-rich repeat (LRR) protein